METSECPICDSKNIEIKEEVKKVFVPMAEHALQKVRICHCNDCNSDIRLSSDSQEVVEQRIKEKANESMPSLIEKINNAGYSDARLERALDLAPHTVYRWKQGKQISATVLALARYIASQPKLIDFAEEGFADSDLKIDVYGNEEFYRDAFNYCSALTDYFQKSNFCKKEDNEININHFSEFDLALKGEEALCM